MLSNTTSLMKVSVERGTYKVCDAKKVAGGQYHTKSQQWLKQHIAEFIQQANAQHYVDPFAGHGDLFRTLLHLIGEKSTIGYDLDPTLHWPINDSLIEIPKHPNSILVTNPPYLAKHSAKRKGVEHSVCDYYNDNGFDDLYLIAMSKCIKSYDKCVFIVPETYVNSNTRFDGIVSITIILESIFDDTDTPVCVVCYDKSFLGDVQIFIGDHLIGRLAHLNSFRLRPKKDVPIRFNVPDGRIGLRAVDMLDSSKKIKFMPASELKYNAKNIKNSSRLITYIDLDGVQNDQIPKICEKANELLIKIREATYDIIFSPFKGNAKDGTRRRRLDYDLARAILEIAYKETVPMPKTPAQLRMLSI